MRHHAREIRVNALRERSISQKVTSGFSSPKSAVNISTRRGYANHTHITPSGAGVLGFFHAQTQSALAIHLLLKKYQSAYKPGSVWGEPH